MIELLPAPPQVAAFHFSGTLTGEDYDRCIESVEDKLRQHPRIGLFCDNLGRFARGEPLLNLVDPRAGY